MYYQFHRQCRTRLHESSIKTLSAGHDMTICSTCLCVCVFTSLEGHEV